MTLPADPARRRTARLRLMATTDLHMHLTAFDYFAEQPTAGGALSRLATLAQCARDEAAQAQAAVLLMDNGDGMQGTPMGDMAAANPAQPHPLMRAFALMGYDAIGLGNHDFNFGIDALDAALAHAPCPVLCSNLRRLRPGILPGVCAHAILDRPLPGPTPDAETTLRIGLLSFLPPQTARWDAHLLAGRIAVDDILSSARARAADLRDAGCDLIVALAHSGLGPAQAEPGMENAVIPLAGLDGIDAVIAGHTHQNLPGPDHSGMPATDATAGSVHGKPVLMPGSAGSHLGVIDLDLETGPGGGWRIAGFRSQLRPATGIGPDGTATPLAAEHPGLCDALAPDHRATVAAMARPVGHSDTPLHSYFSLITPDRALACLAETQAAALRPLLAGSPAGDLPMLSAAAPAKCGGRAGPEHYTDVPAGTLCARHIADLCPFPNDLRAVILNGRQLIDWLEMSASLFRQVAPGTQGTPLLDPDAPAHNFDVLHGLTYQIDLTRPARFDMNGELRADAGHRITSVSWQGAPLDPDQRFVVALNSYRAAGGGNVAALRGAEQVPVPRLPIREALQRHVAASGQPGPLANSGPAWRFARCCGTSVLALTGPRAERHLGDLTGHPVTLAGQNADGFLQLLVGLGCG